MEKLQSSGLKNDLIKIVVEKLLIAVLLIFIGLITNKLIEKYKSQQSFTQILNKTRIEKLAEAWTLVNKIENEAVEINTIRDTLNIIETSLASYTDLKELEKSPLLFIMDSKIEILKQKGNLYQKPLFYVNENRFWIGEEERKILVSFINSYKTYVEGILKGYSDKNLNALEDSLNISRMDVIKTRDKFFAE